MRNATKIFVLSAGLIAAGGCRQNQAEENIVITNEIPADADIEALPPDESAGTPTDELVNGSVEPEANDLNEASNSE